MHSTKSIPNIFTNLYFKELIEYEKIDKTARQENKLAKTMAEACAILEEIGVKYWISRGSILGIHRDHKFLPKDIDIDIDVYTDKGVYEIIRKFPYDVLVAAISEGHYMQLAFLDRETEVVFDIWFYYPYGREVINRNFFGYFLLPEENIATLSTIQFNDRTYPTFPDLDWYCRYWYGDTWKTPRAYNQDWSIDYQRDCQAFVFTGEKNVTYKKYY